MINALPWPIFAATPTGKVIQANAAGLRLLDATDVGRELEKQLRTFAGGRSSRGTLAKPAARQSPLRTRDLYLGRAALRLHPLPTELARLLGRDCVLIGVERRTVDPLADVVLRERFGQTPRQARIARELARGKRAADIACELHLNIHTVRRHTEAVLLKLGVTSRAALIYRVLGEELEWDEWPKD